MLVLTIAFAKNANMDVPFPAKFNAGIIAQLILTDGV
jgi:hypothetical protein